MLSLREFFSRLTASEFLELRAFFLLEPHGAERDDWRTAQQTAYLLNAWKGKRGDLFTPEDVVLDFEPFGDEDDEDDSDAPSHPSLNDLRLAAQMCAPRGSVR